MIPAEDSGDVFADHLREWASGPEGVECARKVSDGTWRPALAQCDTCGDVANAQPGSMCGRDLAEETGSPVEDICLGTYREAVQVDRPDSTVQVDTDDAIALWLIVAMGFASVWAFAGSRKALIVWAVLGVASVAWLAFKTWGQPRQ